MRVVLVSETFVPSVDGVVTRLTRLVDHLVSRGHEVRVVAPGLGEREYASAPGPLVPISGAPTVTAPFYPSRPFSLPGPRARRMVDALVRQFRPDVIHAAQPILLARTAVWAARKYRIPLVASYHTNLPAYLSRYPAWSWAAPLIDWGTRRMHRHATVNVVTSAAMREVARASGFPNVEVVRRGVDTVMHHPGKRSQAMRERMGGGRRSGEMVLLFVGRLAAEKDIGSLAPMMRSRDHVSLALVGDGPQREAIAREFRGTRTRLLGILRGEELAAAYASADAFVFPSVTETLGLVILEAMASGLPIIAARSGPTLEQVRHGETGLVYGSGAELESALETLREPGLAGRMGRLAREEAERCGWERASADVVDAYERAIRLGP